MDVTKWSDWPPKLHVPGVVALSLSSPRCMCSKVREKHLHPTQLFWLKMWQTIPRKPFNTSERVIWHLTIVQVKGGQWTTTTTIHPMDLIVLCIQFVNFLVHLESAFTSVNIPPRKEERSYTYSGAWEILDFMHTHRCKVPPTPMSSWIKYI
jgi:hypothetical protein